MSMSAGNPPVHLDHCERRREGFGLEGGFPIKGCQAMTWRCSSHSSARCRRGRPAENSCGTRFEKLETRHAKGSRSSHRTSASPRPRHTCCQTRPRSKSGAESCTAVPTVDPERKPPTAVRLRGTPSGPAPCRASDFGSFEGPTKGSRPSRRLQSRWCRKKAPSKNHLLPRRPPNSASFGARQSRRYIIDIATPTRGKTNPSLLFLSLRPSSSQQPIKGQFCSLSPPTCSFGGFFLSQVVFW